MVQLLCCLRMGDIWLWLVCWWDIIGVGISLLLLPVLKLSSTQKYFKYANIQYFPSLTLIGIGSNIHGWLLRHNFSMYDIFYCMLLYLYITCGASMLFGMLVNWLCALPAQCQWLVAALKSYWLLSHVFATIAGYACLIAGCLLTCQVITVASSQRNSISIEMLPITGHESVNVNKMTAAVVHCHWNSIGAIITCWYHWLFVLGFFLLTLGLIAGSAWANTAWGRCWGWDPKEVWALLVWLSFAVYLHVHQRQQSLHQVSLILAAVGYFIIWLCFLGISIIGSGFHVY